MNLDEIGKQIVDAAYEVHKTLGPGLLESAYEACLKHELTLRGIRFVSQKEVPLIYKGIRVDVAYRLDLLVEDVIIVEIKSTDRLTDINLAQIISYLKLKDLRLGYLINFNVKYFKNGIKRVANNFADE
ncbi:MAG: GxxExxY protein [Ignavibacteria bacterium]|nr:GxxExxY protein [Ignavibacteria bacterium]